MDDDVTLDEIDEAIAHLAALLRVAITAHNVGLQATHRARLNKLLDARLVLMADLVYPSGQTPAFSG